MKRELLSELKRAEDETLDEGVRVAQRLSSGGLSPATLALLGHPYSRRRASPRIPVLPINRQTGRFYAGWKKVSPRRRGAKLVSIIRNRDPKAKKVVEGDSKVFPRPIDKAIIEEITPRRVRRLEIVIGEVFK